jgi:hypothetical protein
MLRHLRLRAIGLGFKAWIWSVRLRRVVAALGRPRLRGIEHLTIAVTDLGEAGASIATCWAP